MTSSDESEICNLLVLIEAAHFVATATRRGGIAVS